MNCFQRSRHRVPMCLCPNPFCGLRKSRRLPRTSMDISRQNTIDKQKKAGVRESQRVLLQTCRAAIRATLVMHNLQKREGINKE